MNNNWKIVLTISVLALLTGASHPKSKMICSNLDDAACINRMIRNPPLLKQARLPTGTKIGRCLLVVDGRTRISGPCSYRIYNHGEFHIDGPRQIFDGIDYPKAEITAGMISTDYWADVFRDSPVVGGQLKNGSGLWTGYGNETNGSVHGEGSRWGELRQRGACFSNEMIPGDHQRVRVCLWKK